MDDKDWFGPYPDPVLCPECSVRTPWAEWNGGRLGCEDCGDHAAVFCPSCGEGFDHVWGDRTLSDANPEPVVTGSAES